MTAQRKNDRLKMLLTTADTTKIFANQSAHFDDMPYLTSAI